MDVKNFAVPEGLLDDVHKDLLIETAKTFKLKVSGTKADLIKRIREYYRSGKKPDVEVNKIVYAYEVD
jgi:hypothetical protein